MSTKHKARSRAGGMDWDGVRQRLERARAAIDEAGASSRDRQEQILRERAVALAQPDATDAAATQSGGIIEALVFHAAGERYAFETAYVARVYPIMPITAIPGVPDFVVGIVAAEGELLSVVDLRSLLDLPLSRLAEPKAIVMLQTEAMEFGVLAEEIVGVERHAADSLERELPTLADAEKTYLMGITPSRIAVLDAKRLLSDARLVVDVG